MKFSNKIKVVAEAHDDEGFSIRQVYGDFRSIEHLSLLESMLPDYFNPDEYFEKEPILIKIDDTWSHPMHGGDFEGDMRVLTDNSVLPAGVILILDKETLESVKRQYSDSEKV